MELENLGLLTQVMTKLLHPGVRISDDHVTKLVKYFTGIKDPVTQELFNHVLQLWFAEAIDVWETTFPSSSELFTLCLNIAVHLSSDESSFVKLNDKGLFQRFIKLIKSALRELNATPNVGYIRLMSSFLKHGPGVQWMLSESYWFETVNLALGYGHDPMLIEECYKFIAQLIEKSASLCSDSCQKMIHNLFKPILDFIEVTNIRCHFDEEEFLNHCTTTMNLLDAVVELIVFSKDVTAYEQVMECIDKYEFENHAYVVIQKVTNLDACYKMTNISFKITFMDFVCNCKGAKALSPGEVFVKARKTQRFRKEIAQAKIFSFFQRIIYNGIRWADKIRDIVPKFICNQNSTSPMEQFAYFQLTTVAFSTLKFLGEEYLCGEYDDTFRFRTSNMLYKRILPITLYFVYDIKNYMRDYFSFNTCISALEYILKSRPYFQQTEANIVLMFCIYNYEDFSRIIDDEIILSDPLALEYLAYLIELIVTFLTDFDPNWQDVLQGLTLISITLKVLKSSNSTKKIIINGLGLMRIAVSKKLSLNMALLKDEMDDEVDQLLAVCVKKMKKKNDPAIQSAAIQVIESVCQSVGKDFHIFKTMILSKKVPTKIANKAVKNKNHLVKASAFRCLQEMAKVEEFWTTISTNNKIYENVCQILINEPDGTVRSEAAKLISIIYEQEDLPSATLFRFYDVMTHSVVEDTDTDTRISAIEFWKNVIRRHLTDQGWIDGKFPDVTFSVDTKKIVIMSEEEIRKRLVKVLFQLSEIGCLFVLTTALAHQKHVFFETVHDLGKKFLQLLNDNKVDNAILDNAGYCKNLSFTSDFGYDGDMDMHKKIMSRQALHPKDFLNSIDIFLNISETNETPDQQFDIVPLLEEILYEDGGTSPLVYEEL